MHMGEMTFKQRGEQAEADGTAQAEKVSFLLGVNSNDFIKCLVKPKIKVGTEVVTQGRTKEQVRLREEMWFMYFTSCKQHVYAICDYIPTLLLKCRK